MAGSASSAVEVIEKYLAEARKASNRGDDSGDHIETTESGALDIPSEVVKYFLRKAGCQSSDPDFNRVVSFVATQFLTEVIGVSKDSAQFLNKTQTGSQDSDSGVLRIQQVAKGLNSKRVPSIVPTFLN
eukprot:CAMPEP_0195529458 /NCGR_PEP_ID=MMETSP0794_2-20130614/31997_1 /TAXON_ID=515487 /ORGANISM="Stephanopyxis turris, Strain CCMP 815" /LENGTH=128 /DNA_ID=CAMNT_0040660765 /DNA_START=54 /DNA_END=440 /DNA_ORIENTATION=+